MTPLRIVALCDQLDAAVRHEVSGAGGERVLLAVRPRTLDGQRLPVWTYEVNALGLSAGLLAAVNGTRGLTAREKRLRARERLRGLLAAVATGLVEDLGQRPFWVALDSWEQAEVETAGVFVIPPPRRWTAPVGC